MYIYLFNVCQAGSGNDFRPRSFWASKKHTKTRENHENESPFVSETYKNTYVSARSQFGLENARKHPKTQKHTKTRVLSVCRLLPTFWALRKTFKNTVNQTHLP